MACSGSSHAENGTGRFPCLRRENRSSSAAPTTVPSTTSAADGSWKIALTPRTRMRTHYPREPPLTPGTSRTGRRPAATGRFAACVERADRQP